MSKIPAVAKVEVSLKEGTAVIQLKPGNTAHLDEFIRKVRDNGFTPKEARVSVRGELVSKDGKLELKVLGVNDIYDLTPGPRLNLAEFARNAGKLLLIEGVVPAPKNKSPVRALEVNSSSGLTGGI